LRIPIAVRAAAWLALLPAAVAAQPVLGGGEDATVLRRGRARIRLGAQFESARDQFGAPGSALDARQPIGRAASFDTLGVRLLSSLAPLQDTLRLLTGAPDLVASLGQLRTDARIDVQTLPITAEFGLFDRVTLSVFVPYVRTRSSVNPVVDPVGGGGNLGINPALVTSDASGAVTRNGTLFTQLGAAVTALQSLATTCAAPNRTEPRCQGFAPATAAALVQDANAFRTRVAYLYGSGSNASPGRPFVPVAGSPTQRAVEGRVRDLSQRFNAYGVAALLATSTPAGATTRLGLAGINTILSDEEFGIVGDSLRGRLLSGTGDVDLAASVQWLDTFRGDERARLAPRGLHLRSTLTAGYRLGTGSGDFPSIWFDVPTGTGVNALLLRSATDVVLGRRAWATAVVRYTRPFTDRPVLRVPATVGDFFVPASREVQIERTLGSELQVELTPRLTISDVLGVWGQYQLRTKGADRNVGAFEVDATETAPATTVDGSYLDANSEAREQRVGLGLTYSTVAAYTRGRSSLPLEVSWVYRTTMAGSGGVLRASGQQVLVRLYLRILGARDRTLSGVR
jgi:hypothetical protein